MVSYHNPTHQTFRHLNLSSSHTGISEGDGMDELHAAEEPMATGEAPRFPFGKNGSKKTGERWMSMKTNH